MRTCVPFAGRFAVACLLAMATSGCVPRDDAAGTDGPARGAGSPTDPARLPPVALPDLSRLAAPAAAQVRARYQSVQDARAGSAAGVAAAYGALGLVLMAAEYFDAAAVSYRQAEARAPGDPRWPYYLGHLHRMTEERGAAVAAFERALSLRPADVATLVWLGRARLDEGRPELAERQFRQAAAFDPGSAAALAGAGRAALARRNFLGAAEYLERALAAAPQASRLHYPLAMAYRALGEVELAEAHLARRGDVEPPLSDPLMEELDALLPSAMKLEGQGIRALRNGMWSAAVDYFRRGLELEPDNASLRQRLATALAAGGDTRAAVEQLEETLRRTPDFPRAYFSLGAILALQGRRQEAVEHYQAALRLQPGYVEARMGLAEALRGAGRLAEALPHYLRVTEVDPAYVRSWATGISMTRRVTSTKLWSTTCPC